MKLFGILLLLSIILFSPSEAWAQTCGVFHEKINEVCVKFDVPSNAHSADTYDGWICNQGYVKDYRKNRCNKTD